MGMGLSSSDDKPTSNTKWTDDKKSRRGDNKKPAVQVYILLGQSNMVGMGDVKGDRDGTLEHAVKKEGLYPFLQEDDTTCSTQWVTRKNTRYVRYMSGKLIKNEWMTVSDTKVGPELGIGNQVGDYAAAEVTDEDAPVMILKSCIGNRSLGWDLLPPGSESYEVEEKDKTGKATTYVYAGYKQSPLKWEKGTKPEPIAWYAGKQWDTDIVDAKKVLCDLQTYYPDAESFEVAGFFFWQGDKDRYDAGHAARYERNLVQFIKVLRQEFSAPHAKFVCATLGQSSTEDEATEGNDKLILDAQLAVDGETGKYPEFKGNVSTVYTHPISHGGASNGHYNGNAKTFMDVGLGMGEAMVRLLSRRTE
jgi:hypothetical protein